MKKVLLTVLTGLVATNGLCDVTITPATLATSVSADNAVNAATPGFVDIGDIEIVEGRRNDIGSGADRTLVLTGPSGWQFKAGTGTVYADANGDVDGAAISVTASNITVSITVKGASKMDRITISGIQAQSIDGRVVPSTGNIVRSSSNPGSAIIFGVAEDTTVFGQLRQVVGSASQLQFVTTPSTSAIAGVSFSQQPALRLVDQFTNALSVANGFSGSSPVVSAARRSGTGDLKGTTSVAVSSAGIAVFTNLSHEVANTIDLVFTSAGVPNLVSGSIVINPAAANRLAFATQPGSAQVGSPFGVQPVVRTYDAFGNISAVGLPASLSLTVSLTSGGGSLLGTTTRNIGTAAGAGVATFTNLRVDVWGSDKRLTAQATGLASGTSDVFSVEAMPQSIAFNPVSVVYGQAPFSMVAAASSGLPVQLQLISGPASLAGNTVSISAAGFVTVRATQAGDSYYAAAAPVERTFEVLKAPLSVVVQNASRSYGGPDPAFTGTITGIQNADNISATYGTTAVEDSATGTYPIVATLLDPNNRLSNYEVAITNGTLTIVHGVAFTLEPVAQTVHQGTNLTLTAAATGYSLSYQWNVNGSPIPGATTAALAFSRVQVSDAGRYSVTVSNSAISLTSAEADLVVIADNDRPVLKVNSTNVTFHSANAIDGVVFLDGKATDDVRVEQLLCSVNGGPFTAVELDAGRSVNWSAPLRLEVGTNRVVLKSIDMAGNESLPLGVSAFYSVTTPLTYSINGAGIVVPANSPFGVPANGNAIIVGRPYKLIAMPAPGNLFTNWTRVVGGVTNVYSSSATLNFVMESNLVLQANFIPNPFIRAAGVYNGLFYEADGVKHHSSGFITLKVTSNLVYSGKLSLDGNVVPVSGKFDLPGTVTKTVLRTKMQKSALTLNLALDLSGADRLTGSVQDTNWTAEIVADRLVWTTTNLATAFTNTATFVLPSIGEPQHGYCHGVVTVDAKGFANLTGKVTDGVPVKQKVSISGEGYWPLFASLNPEKRRIVTPKTSYFIVEHRGSLLGWLSVSGEKPAGTLSWIKTPVMDSNQIHHEGVTNQGVVTASRYIAPSAGERALNLSEATLLVQHMNMPEPVSMSATISHGNHVLVNRHEFMDFTGIIRSKTGVFEGQLIDRRSPTVKTKVYGVILQEYNAVAGFFVGGGHCGAVTLQAPAQ